MVCGVVLWCAELELKRHGLKFYFRDPSSFTPMLDGRSLMMGPVLTQPHTTPPLPNSSAALSHPTHCTGYVVCAGICDGSQWSLISVRSLSSVRKTPRPTLYTTITSVDSHRTIHSPPHTRPPRFIPPTLAPSLTPSPFLLCPSFFEPFLDAPPPGAGAGGWKEWMAQVTTLRKMGERAYKLGGGLMDFHEVMTAPAYKILSRWFESEPLKSTLATDAIIGAMTSPR